MFALFVIIIIVSTVSVTWFMTFDRTTAGKVWAFKYLYAMLPLAVTLGGYLISMALFALFGCHGDIKHIQGCDSLEPLFGIGLFWLPLVSIFITGPISIWKLFVMGLTHIGSKSKTKSVR